MGLINVGTGKLIGVSGDSIETSLPVWYVFSPAYAEKNGKLTRIIKIAVMR